MTMVLLSSTLVKSADCAFRRCQKGVWCCGATWIALLQTKTTLEIHRKLCNMHIGSHWMCLRIPDQNMTHSCSNYVDDGSTVFTKDGKLVLKVSSACPDGTCLNSGLVSWSSLPQAIRYPSTGTLSAGGIVSHQVLAEHLILRVGATVILVSILGTSEYTISSFRCAKVFCGISVPSENLSGRVMSRDAFTYGWLTQHSESDKIGILLHYFVQGLIALSAAIVLMQRLMNLPSFHMFWSHWIGW